MDRLQALRYFLKVAETSSFTDAAKEFSVPASSVSRRVRDLEAHLGVELFRRSTRVVQQTELGRLYETMVQEAVAALDHADAVVSQQSEKPAGVLSITALPGYGRLRLVPALLRFQDLYPEVVLDVQLSDRVADLSKGEVDIAIRASADLPERAVARRLAENRFTLVASPGYLEENGKPTTLGDLERARTLLYRGPNGVLHWQALQDGSWQVVRSIVALASDDGRLLVEAALAGRGIALIPEWGITRELTDGDLIKLELDNTRVSVTRTPDPGIFLLYHRPKYQLKKVRAAVDFLVSALAEPAR
ncbi:MAG: LysR family transcriptional regulator [Polyangiales bacterium]